MHALNPGFNLLGMITLFASGLFFGLAYIYTKNLWFPIALHFSWNFFQGTIFGFNVSGRDTYSLVNIKENSSTIWNGGDFGFEGPVLPILFQFFAILIVMNLFKTRLTNNKLKTTIEVASSQQNSFKFL